MDNNYLSYMIISATVCKEFFADGFFIWKGYFRIDAPNFIKLD
ncbi:hypothetical protein ANACAC_00246 [Anaerostipes caccae L1-92]|uniref:Uncharacterized protein n=1 Tax=Anaerostipes caccae (strain DSM 14662 / CCUG 47493 / JCM 13470 / NCIMB 13811 / L1-92) TaxID=411490 RepID=B0M9M4_ANACD|nr:hypothetical protein ANACAC_00246 [Anaerostipes caccae L1-92]